MRKVTWRIRWEDMRAPDPLEWSPPECPPECPPETLADNWPKIGPGGCELCHESVAVSRLPAQPVHEITMHSDGDDPLLNGCMSATYLFQIDVSFMCAAAAAFSSHLTAFLRLVLLVTTIKHRIHGKKGRNLRIPDALFTFIGPIEPLGPRPSLYKHPSTPSTSHQVLQLTILPTYAKQYFISEASVHSRGRGLHDAAHQTHSSLMMHR